VRSKDRGFGRDWGRSPRRSGPSLRGIGYGLLVVLVILAVLSGVQLGIRSTPAPRLVPSAPATLRVPGSLAGLALPAQGEATVGVLGVGTMASSGGDAPVPVASLTKMMTAYVIISDHPLGATDQGPPVAFTAADVATEAADAAGNQSVVRVAAGEQLSERQALEAILVASANNVASVLSRWDAGSETAFVAKMNQEAARLGMRATHYVDPTGVDPGSVSSASDQVTLAARIMADPVLSSIVGLAEINLPVAGTVFNYDFLVGHDGIIGIKTGSTTEAGGCFVFAALRSVNGSAVVVIGAVIGQHGPSILQAALNASLALANSAAAQLRMVAVSLPDGGVVGHVVAPWAASVPVVATGTWSTVGWAGMTLPVSVSYRNPPRRFSSGAVLARVKLANGSQTHYFTARATAALAGPSAGWKLRRL
jgi:D-alanyl-D-alanine carboxypeptidase (penicillin-binding protein 5/6)